MENFLAPDEFSFVHILLNSDKALRPEVLKDSEIFHVETECLQFTALFLAKCKDVVLLVQRGELTKSGAFDHSCTLFVFFKQGKLAEAASFLKSGDLPELMHND